jgi:hypothetical protein
MEGWGVQHVQGGALQNLKQPHQDDSDIAAGPHLAHSLIAFISELGHLIVCIILACIPQRRVILEVHGVYA